MDSSLPLIKLIRDQSIHCFTLPESKVNLNLSTKERLEIPRNFDKLCNIIAKKNFVEILIDATYMPLIEINKKDNENNYNVSKYEHNLFGFHKISDIIIKKDLNKAFFILKKFSTDSSIIAIEVGKKILSLFSII